MLFRPSFVALAFALAALGIPAKRDAAQVDKDIDSVYSQSQSLDTAILNFSNTSGTLVQALDIHTNANKLGSNVQTTTNDAATSEPFDETDSEAIIQRIKETIAPATSEVLDHLVAKKERLEEIGAGGIALNDLQDLRADTSNFWSVMSNKVSADQQSEAKNLGDTMDREFASAIEAFS